jgi:hypothetical protein
MAQYKAGVVLETLFQGLQAVVSTLQKLYMDIQQSEQLFNK